MQAEPGRQQSANVMSRPWCFGRVSLGSGLARLGPGSWLVDRRLFCPRIAAVHAAM